MANKKQRVKYFVSYASRNKKLADEFLGQFKEITKPSKRYEYSCWRDRAILAGENWHEKIQEAISKCDFGLLLISPAFLGSQYIKEHELPYFLGNKGKHVMPVLLQRVSFEKHDLLGLEEKQIFRLEKPGFKEPRAYGELKKARREDFVYEFFLQVEHSLDKLFDN